MGWNPVKAAEKKAKDAVNGVIKKVLNPALDKVEEKARWIDRKAKDAARSAEGAVNKAAHAAEDAVDDAQDAAIGALRTAGREIEEGLTEKAPELLQDAFEALAAALTSEALEKVRAMLRVAVKRMDELRESKPALVDEINNLGFAVELGPVTLKYSGFYDRADDLMSALGAPPALRRGPICDFVSATAPTSADLGISVQVVAVVVGSKELGIGGGFDEIGGALVVELLDAILEAAGVPE